jgi:hypothetical protein
MNLLNFRGRGQWDGWWLDWHFDGRGWWGNQRVFGA